MRSLAAIRVCDNQDCGRFFNPRAQNQRVCGQESCKRWMHTLRKVKMREAARERRAQAAIARGEVPISAPRFCVNPDCRAVYVARCPDQKTCLQKPCQAWVRAEKDRRFSIAERERRRAAKAAGLPTRRQRAAAAGEKVKRNASQIGCATCEHAKISRSSESGYECTLHAVMRCKPYTVAALYRNWEAESG